MWIFTRDCTQYCYIGNTSTLHVLTHVRSFHWLIALLHDMGGAGYIPLCSLASPDLAAPEADTLITACFVSILVYMSMQKLSWWSSCMYLLRYQRCPRKVFIQSKTPVSKVCSFRARCGAVSTRVGSPAATSAVTNHGRVSMPKGLLRRPPHVLHDRCFWSKLWRV